MSPERTSTRPLRGHEGVNRSSERTTVPQVPSVNRSSERTPYISTIPVYRKGKEKKE